MSTNVAGALLNQLLGTALLLEGDETEVLGCVVFALVYGPDDLANAAELTEMLLDLVLANTRVGELTHIDLAGLDVRLLNCDTFTLELIIKQQFYVCVSLRYYLELMVFVARRIVY